MNTPFPPPDLTPVFSPEVVAQRVKDLGTQIATDYRSLLEPQELLLTIGILNGAFIFLADLVRAMDIPLEIDFVRLTSYQDRLESSNYVVMLKNLEKEIKNRHVLVVEDIADCGLTLSWLLDYLRQMGPKSIRLAVAFNKEERRRVELAIDYVGFNVEKDFLVGYGLDFAQSYRHLPGVHKLKASS
ncbi:MAG: hypoxanthine phosphoribosyltransferase [Deltaproteobacteria bacterium]|jgi:hypoxanthine phosphoribosyltransferase|nr:hypoxanthine phosphoribosyltransferase [Deltaproteobacteria bacterium]